MKNITLKIINFALTLIMVASVLYAIFNMTMAFLPAEVQAEVYGWLHMSQEYIATFSISSTINAVVLVGVKMAQTQTRVNLIGKLAKAEQTINNGVVINDKVVQGFNAVATNIAVLQKLNNALLSVQKVTAERNIASSDKLVTMEEKEAYKNAIAEIEQAQKELAEINNIYKVYEKTEVKEVIVEKPAQDKLSGRV
mgnify:CR=1 FL=1